MRYPACISALNLLAFVCGAVCDRERASAMRQRVEGEMRQHSGGGARDMYGLSPEERVSQVRECRAYLTMCGHGT